MKSALTITGVIVLATALLSTVAHAQKTSAAYDQKADFSSYKTFLFSNESGARNPLVSQKRAEQDMDSLILTGSTLPAVHICG